MKVKRVTLITAAIGVALATFGCKETVPSAAPEKPPNVPVAEVIVRPATPFAEFTGSLAAVKRVELRPRVAGYIQDVSVTAQDDPLRDDALAYSDRLRVFGHLVQAAVLPGPTGWPVSYLEPADAEREKAAWSTGVKQQFSDLFSEFNRNNQAVAQDMPLRQPSFFSSTNSILSL